MKYECRTKASETILSDMQSIRYPDPKATQRK